MKPFLDEDFLLQTGTAVKLYHEFAEAMPIYEIIAPREKATAEEITLCDRYAAAIQDYEAGDCPAAAQKLEQILTEFPDDGPTRFLLQRCHRVIAEPQGEGERGIIRMDAK